MDFKQDEEERFKMALEMRMKEEEEKMRKKIEAEVRAEQLAVCYALARYHVTYILYVSTSLPHSHSL